MDFTAEQGSQGQSSVTEGAELADLTLSQCEILGFSALGGDRNLKLLPTPFPNHRLPPSSASLLSVASRRRLLAAAGPDALVVASTDAVRKALTTHGGHATDASGDKNITDFVPDVSLQVPQLRHVAFSSDEDFLVISAEEGGGLAVYGVEHVLQQGKPTVQISTDGVAVRALVPNPAREYAHYFAVVTDAGRLLVVDITNGSNAITVRAEGVTCVAWSLFGKALVAGLQDGTAAQYKSAGTLMATIPRPPSLKNDEFPASSTIYWLTRDEFLIAHPPSADSEDPIVKFHIVKADKERTHFTFQKVPDAIEFFAGMGPPEERDQPHRHSIIRLKDWQPGLSDMLILGASNSIDTRLLTKSTTPLVYEQDALDEFVIIEPLDNRRPNLPPIPGEDSPGDAAPIGEALDLSSRDTVLKPIPSDDEYRESTTPLPAYYVLNHSGILCAWWVVYDKSIREGTSYPGLVSTSNEDASTPAPAKASEPATSTPQATPKASTATATSIFGTAIAASSSNTLFQQGTATFGQPSQPSFSSFGKPSQPAFGAPSFGTPSSAKLSAPAFGSPSAVGAAASGFGATGFPGKGSSPWASSSQVTTSQTSQNSFSSQAGNTSGFAKFGTPSNSGAGSAFSSFGSAAGQSPFSTLGGGQKSAFSGLSGQPSAFNKVSTEPSFGSTVTVGSSLGAGSTLPSWANTPAQQSGSIFGQAGTSSFASTTSTDTEDARRQRDEATPTPQAPPQQSKGLFGMPTNGFKLTPSFKGDGSAKDDLPKPEAPSSESLFGGTFTSTLDNGTKPPATPIKKEEEEEPRLQDIPSTTPAQPPKSLFPSTTPAQATSFQQKAILPEEAPLPPDPTTWRPKKANDEDLPQLAGSPAVKVEAPDSDVPSSPLDEQTDREDDFSVEEQDGGDEEDEDQDAQPSPSDAANRFRPAKTGWTLNDSVNQSPHIRPAAPTPPAVKSGTSSRSGDLSRPPSAAPAQPSLFGSKQATSSSLFQQSATPTGFPKPTTTFQAPINRANESLRSPSPVRSASTSRIGTRRQQIFPTEGSLSSSTQQPPRQPSPQHEVSELSDDEDDRIREELASEVKPGRTLETFIAHQDYTGAVKKTGTAAQIEIMYRDMNSMVDTVGLNARSLKSFTAYHSRVKRITRGDLEDVIDEGDDGPWFEKWCIGEIEGLKDLETNLEKELDAGRVSGVLDKLSQLSRLLRDSSKILTKVNDIRRQLINRKDPERTEALRKAALPKELAEQQKNLRTEYARLLALLGQAEEAAFLLKSKLASVHATNGKTSAVPTVDAVKKTINRLIHMTERKNNDILLLESKLQKANLNISRPGSSSSLPVGTPSQSRALVRAQSPLPTTPQTGKSKMSLSDLNRNARTPEVDDTPSKGYGLYYTPEGSPTATDFERGSGDLIKLANYLEEKDLTALRETQGRRKKVAVSLADAVLKKGVKVTKVG